MASINNYSDAEQALFEHEDHVLLIVAYGPVVGPRLNIAIQCEECGVIVQDWDNPEVEVVRPTLPR